MRSPRPKKPKGPKLQTLPREQWERRDIDGHSYRPEANGRSMVIFECPFCGDVIEAYLWSLAGGGKRCWDGCEGTVRHGCIVSLKDKEIVSPISEEG